MKKQKYYYNPQTLRYERIRLSRWQQLLKVLGFVSATIVSAFLILVFAYTFLESPKEKQLESELNQMSINFERLSQRIGVVNQLLGELEERDNNIYRVIFEAEPIPNEVRNMGIGGSHRYEEFKDMQYADLLKETASELDRLEKKLYVQSKSFDEITKMIKSKESMLASIPAIQPVNSENSWFASGYGTRIDPIYKTKKFHAGVDFSAPLGTNIYATGDGTIKKVKYSRKGYGNSIVIDHGYGYETLYAHCSKILVKRGQKVKRGELIGLVGSSGKSTAPHCHYEVHKDKRKLNPINFFYNDITPEEFNELVEQAERNNQSFD